MKIKYFLFLFFIGIFIQSQVVVNDKLMVQLSKNQAARLASNEAFLKSYEKQKKLYDDVNKKITQIIFVQEFIYDKLTKVNQTIKQGKQLKYLYRYLDDVIKNSKKMLKLTAQKPQYAILQTRYYNAILKEVSLIYSELKDQILKEGDRILIDTYDREYLINKVFDRVRILHGNVLYINIILETAEERPYIYHIPTLDYYINLDKLIIDDILRKYNYLKN